jgi:hypothetical protein
MTLGGVSRLLAGAAVVSLIVTVPAQPASARPHAPSPRSEASMAYDAAREQVVLFGGIVQGGRRGDTWTWDGGDWTHQPATGPLAASQVLLGHGVRPRP